MPELASAHLIEIGAHIFDAVGSPPDESVMVSEILTRSRLVGYDSHGALRILQNM